MFLDNTNGTLDTPLHSVRIVCDNLQGHIMKMAKSLHFSTDKFFSVIDVEEFGYTFGNSDVISEQIDGFGTRFGVRSNNVIRAFIHDTKKY